MQHTFFVHFLAVVLHDYNVKRPETSWFSRFMEEMWYMFLFTFSTAAYFFIAPLKNSSLFGDPGANWIFLKITKASIFFPD